MTRDGLEDQLLAAVVSMERPDLEQLKVCRVPPKEGRKGMGAPTPCCAPRCGRGGAVLQKQSGEVLLELGGAPSPAPSHAAA